LSFDVFLTEQAEDLMCSTMEDEEGACQLPGGAGSTQEDQEETTVVATRKRSAFTGGAGSNKEDQEETTVAAKQSKRSAFWDIEWPALVQDGW
jgi:hypothetical protein